MAWQTILHYFLHLIFPFAIAWVFFRKNWKKAGLIMFLTILVDIDHVFANPVFDPMRCSINFHPLHSYWAIGIYFAGLFYQKTRWIAIGLIVHMSADLLDCFLMYRNCLDCQTNSVLHDLAITPGFT